MKLAAERKIIVSAHIALDFPGTPSIAVHVDGPSPGSPPAWLRAPGLWWCKHREGRCGSRGRRRWPASKPIGKQRAPPRQTTLLASRRANPGGAFHGDGQSPRRARPVQQPAGVCGSRGSLREDRPVDKHRTVAGGSGFTIQASIGGRRFGDCLVPGADRPRASTKRAVLIGMLERPEGASVAELGQRLGWLPHTVRAAITGLHHTGREVTRSKNTTGQSVYRLVLVETTPDR